MDNDTECKNRFDMARILVSINSLMEISSIASVKYLGGTCKIIVADDDEMEANFMQQSNVEGLYEDGGF